jgi:molecular chaperone DnaK (HSP70)
VETLATQDLSLIQGLNNQEIQNAIEELKRSTAAIEKQTEALQLQQNAMASLVKNDKRTRQTRANIGNGQVRKWDVEKGHINAAVRSLSSLRIGLS